MNWSFWGLFVALALLATGVRVQAEVIYWTQGNNSPTGGEIRRANIDGSDQTTLVKGLDGPLGINLDVNAGKMYWADINPTATGIGDVRSANLDGTGVKKLLSVTSAINVVLDLPDSKLYFTDDPPGGAGRIGQANLDGTGSKNVISNVAASGVALDLAGRQLYWTNNPDTTTGHGSIRRANLDGTLPTVLVRNLTTPNGIALDTAGGKIYWAQAISGPNQSGTGAIYRANLDGTGQETLASALPEPLQVALDLPAGKIYWADNGAFTTTGTVPGTGDIRRANLDGSDQEVVISGLTQPAGVALAVPEPSALLMGVAGCWLLCRRRHPSSWEERPLLAQPSSPFA